MISRELVEELKMKLDITWDDIDIENKLTRIVESAKEALDFKLGINYDYSIPGMEKTLFLNYCMYEYNNCINDFDKNYLSELMLIRNKHQVMRFRNEKNKV
ncbi:MAG: hypothetical protein ACRCX8_08450 [Sarcina sp.]